MFKEDALVQLGTAASWVGQGVGEEVGDGYRPMHTIGSNLSRANRLSPPAPLAADGAGDVDLANGLKAGDEAVPVGKWGYNEWAWRRPVW
jgi:hypothetical protein